MIRRLFLIPLVVLALAVTTELPAQEPAGAIRGIVQDRDFQVPLSGARIQVAGTALVALTGSDGSFLIQGVPPGTYALTVSKGGYDREVIPNITVGPSRMTELRVELAAEVVVMDEMVITGADLPISGELATLEIRETAISVQDALSSEIMKKAGVSDVAGALKLVVGASVSEGKYATVRGLSDRYTGTTLNGVRIPSADPRRRAVQIDMFPTGTIDNLTVTKTFTPDLQGDFTGGGLDIRTKSIPDGTVLSVSGTLENNDMTTGDEFLTYVGGGVDSFGFASGRELPDEADDPLPRLPTFSPRPTADQMAASQAYDRLVRSFEPYMGVEPVTAPSNTGFSVTAGRRFETEGKIVMGLLGSITQSRKFDGYLGGVNNSGGVSDPTSGIGIFRERVDNRGVDEVLVGGLLTFVIQPNGNHEVSTRLVANQSAEDEARLQLQSQGGDLFELNQALHYTERGVVSWQLNGLHRMPGWRDLSVDWTGSYNLTRQDEPDVRFFRNTFDESTFTSLQPANSTSAQNTRRIFREVGENNVQGMVNATLPFTQWSQQPSLLKGGLFIDATDRDYEQRSFSYSFATPQVGSLSNPARRENIAKLSYTGGGPEDLWTDVFLDDNRVGLAANNPPAPNQLLWFIEELKFTDVNYTGDQSISAAYAMADLPLAKKLKTIFGLRYETTGLTVIPVNEFSGNVELIEVQPSGDRAIVLVPQEEAQAEIDDAVALPSVGLVYEPAPHMNLRGTWSRTLARPTFREMAPVATEEFIFGDEFVGNPELTQSHITNYDLRWEWFRRAGEVLSASVFYKSLRDPIELISFSAGGRVFVQPVNFSEGEVYGFELEARLPLDFIHESVKDLTFGVNYTGIKSFVLVPQEEQDSLESFALDEEKRRLQGQPDYVLNLNIAYDNPKLGTSVGLFYNKVGEMLRTGAARGESDGVPNVFEESFGTLNVTFSQRLSGGFSINVKASNIFAEDRTSVYRTPDGQEALKSMRETPVLYSLSATWAY